RRGDRVAGPATAAQFGEGADAGALRRRRPGRAAFRRGHDRPGHRRFPPGGRPRRLPLRALRNPGPGNKRPPHPLPDHRHLTGGLPAPGPPDRRPTARPAPAAHPPAPAAPTGRARPRITVHTSPYRPLRTPSVRSDVLYVRNIRTKMSKVGSPPDPARSVP